ncbi:MAG TPA: penicillin-binding protein 1B, partial [Stenotrophomonas sp.]
GDHLAVIWMGNDQNEQTGLFGASGAMRVWSGIFRNLPSKALHVNNKGLDWQYVEAAGSNATDESCPGARRFPFVVGYAPQYVPCALPAEVPLEEGAEGAQEQSGGGWRGWLGLDRKEPEPAVAPAAQTPAR